MGKHPEKGTAKFSTGNNVEIQNAGCPAFVIQLQADLCFLSVRQSITGTCKNEGLSHTCS